MVKTAPKYLNLKIQAMLPLFLLESFLHVDALYLKNLKNPFYLAQSGEIQVNYDTKRTGIFQKAITVKSNSKTPNVILRIKGEVLPEPEESEEDKELINN